MADDTASLPRTRWFRRNEPPVRPGLYECAVRVTNSQRTLFKWMLQWDGTGFLVPMPMVVHQWRGITRRAAAALAGAPA